MKRKVVQVIVLEERKTEKGVSGRRYLVDVGGQTDAGREGPNYDQRHHHHLDEVIQPGYLNVGVLIRKGEPWIVLMIADFLLGHADVVVLLHQVVDCCDCMKQRQQEYPECEYQDSNHRVSGEGTDKADNHYNYRSPGISPVRDVDFLAKPDIDCGLPYDEDEQCGRENQGHYAGREVDGSHQYAQEGKQEGGEVNVP